MFEPKTILITGGGTGIGKGLAQAFHQRGSKVIIGGRREAVLREVAEANPGMDHIVIDVADPASVAAAATSIAQRHPTLDCLINNAGVQHRIDFSGQQQASPEALRWEIETNLIGLIQTTSAFLPQLLRQDAASVINVSSGLALTPLAGSAIYCATKAAVHSFSMSLRHQLKAKGVRVIEVMPPLVIDTELHDAQEPLPEAAKTYGQSVAEFVDETLGYLDSGEDEMGVGRVRDFQQQVRPIFAEPFAMMNGAW